MSITGICKVSRLSQKTIKPAKSKVETLKYQAKSSVEVFKIGVLLGFQVCL